MAVTEATVAVFFLEYTPPEGNLGPLHVFLFNPITIVTLTGDTETSNYTVIFNLTSNIPGAVIVGLEPRDETSATPPDLQTPSLSNNGLTITASFTNDGLTEPTNYGFRMKVRADGTDYTSDDPEIVVPPPND